MNPQKTGIAQYVNNREKEEIPAMGYVGTRDVWEQHQTGHTKIITQDIREKLKLCY